MKIAEVIPILKSGNKNSFDNYRHILLGAKFSIFLETIFHYRMEIFSKKYNK